MPQTNIPSPFGDNEFNDSAKRSGQRLVRRSDLVELVLEPLSAQIDQTRFEILGKIQEVNDSTEIIARQMRREMDE